VESDGFRRHPQDSRIPSFSLGKFKDALGNPRESYGILGNPRAS